MERDRAIIEHTADALFVYDTEGRIVDVNRRACATLGYTREELLSLSITDVETSLLPGGLAGVWRLVAPDEDRMAEGNPRRKEGRTIPGEGRGGPIDGYGRRVGLAAASG